MIKKLNEINTIQVDTYPGVPNRYNHPIKQNVQVPGTFLKGEGWDIKHACKQCGNDVHLGNVRLEQENSSWFFMHYLSRRSIPDVQLMDKIGALFKLDLATDFSGNQPGSYRVYTLTGMYKNMATIAYYQCPKCKSQYLMAFADVVNSGEVYVEKILRVSGNYDALVVKSNEVYVEKTPQVRVDYDVPKIEETITQPPPDSPYKYMWFLDIYMRNKRSSIKGCTEEEVDRLEQRWGVKFPLAYREIYLIKGYYAFGFHEGNEFDLKEYHTMRYLAGSYLIPEYEYLIDDKDVFIFSVNGEHGVFWFFRLDEGDDPPVYKYNADDEIEKVRDSLSDCVKEQGYYRASLR